MTGLAIMRGGNELTVPLQNFPRTVITSSGTLPSPYSNSQTYI